MSFQTTYKEVPSGTLGRLTVRSLPIRAPSNHDLGQYTSFDLIKRNEAVFSGYGVYKLQSVAPLPISVHRRFRRVPRSVLNGGIREPSSVTHQVAGGTLERSTPR